MNIIKHTFSLCLLFLLCTFASSQTYDVENVISNLNQPIAFAILPDSSFIVTLKNGPVKVYNFSGTYITDFWDFTDSVNNNLERGVTGVCVDKHFLSNHFVYVYYVHLNPQYFRLVRFVESNHTGTDPHIIFQYAPGAINGNHVGANMRFGADDKIYMSIGDVFVDANGQDRTNPLGKILRFNRDGTIPTDNPFYDDGNPNTGNEDRIWALGLRNPFDFCFSPINDSLYTEDNGFHGGDEANYITRGKNYGWPICEARCNPPIDSLKEPMYVWEPEISTTGVMIYSGTQMPQIYNHLLIAGYNDGKIYDCKLERPPAYDSISTVTELLQVVPVGLTTLMQGPDEFIYALEGGYITSGGLFRIKPHSIGIEPVNGNMPAGYVLHQNYPNPFNPVTKIKFEVPLNKGGARGLSIKLIVYDCLGKEVSKLVDDAFSSGSYEIVWDASNFPSGVYFYKLTAGSYAAEKKMVLIK